jgi:hypothetical protein
MHSCAYGCGDRCRMSDRSLAASLRVQFDLDRGHVGLTLNLAFLSPTLIRAIVRGEQPPGLRLNRLLRGDIPLSWREQEVAFTPSLAAYK